MKPLQRSWPLRVAAERIAVRSVFWFLGLAAVAVALALLMGQNEASVTLYWAPWRVDLSFNLVLFALIAGFLVVHLALLALSALRAMPERARQWRSQQQERAIVGAVADAMAHQLAGRFVRAQASATQAVDQLGHANADTLPRHAQWHVLSHLLLAESAHALRNRELRDAHLAQAIDPRLSRAMPQAREGALLRAARWAVDDRDAATAERWLGELPQGAARRIQALRLRLRVDRLKRETLSALDTARLLAKHRAFTPEAAASVLRGLVTDALRDAHDPAQLQTLWHSLDPQERAMPEAALAAAERLQQVAVDMEPEARAAQARRWLLDAWNRYDSLEPHLRRRLVLALENGLVVPDVEWLGRIETLQRQYPNDPLLQYLAGQACMQRQLWGKAAQLLGQASTRLEDREMLRRTWCSLARLAEERGDHSAAQAAWKRAAQI